MNPSADFYRKVYPFSALFVICALFLVWYLTPRAESALTTPERVEIANYDIRADKSETARATTEKFVSEAGKTASDIAAALKPVTRAESTLRTKVPGLKIERSENLQVPEVISADFVRSAAFLTAPSGEKRAVILKNFLEENAGLFGLNDSQIDALKLAADYTNPDGNLSYVHFEQRINGIGVFGGEVKAGLTKRGEIIRVINNLAPGLDYGSLSTDFGNPLDAVKAAAGFINTDAGKLDLRQNEAASTNLKTIFGEGDWATGAEKMYFPTEPGVAVPAW